VRDGTLATRAFDTWLVQDYLFVADLLVFQARLLARAPRPSQAVLANGLVALETELGWFEQHAVRRGLQLDVPRQPVTAAYTRLFDALDAGAYPAAIAAVWAMERVYLEAWTAARPGAAAYRDFIEHWTVPAFGAYVEDLARAVDLALSTATPDAQTTAEQAVADVLRLERDFWEAAWSAPAAP
jgi:formylaminopyrimidine deformylase / aminopyrimidine aminohydrolase